MPPKCKFTREEIVSAALAMAKTEGIDCITARSLGAKLGSSPKPIFTVFENMKEVQDEVILSAKALYRSYVQTAFSRTGVPAFKAVGEEYVKFAINEPKLFRLLFMSEQESAPTIENVLPIIDESYNEILSSIETGYGLSAEDAAYMYRHLWVYTHGIAVLCATNTCSFTEELISEMLTDVFVSLLKERKSK